MRNQAAIIPKRPTRFKLVPFLERLYHIPACPLPHGRGSERRNRPQHGAVETHRTFLEPALANAETAAKNYSDLGATARVVL